MLPVQSAPSLRRQTREESLTATRRGVEGLTRFLPQRVEPPSAFCVLRHEAVQSLLGHRRAQAGDVIEEEHHGGAVVSELISKIGRSMQVESEYQLKELFPPLASCSRHCSRFGYVVIDSVQRPQGRIVRCPCKVEPLHIRLQPRLAPPKHVLGAGLQPGGEVRQSSDSHRGSSRHSGSYDSGHALVHISPWCKPLGIGTSRCLTEEPAGDPRRVLRPRLEIRPGLLRPGSLWLRGGNLGPRHPTIPAKSLRRTTQRHQSQHLTHPPMPQRSLSLRLR